MAVDPLSHMLGKLEQGLDTITKTLSDDRLASAAYRTDMRREVGEVKETLYELKSDVRSVISDVAEMKPDVEDYVRKRDQGIGMVGLTKTVWSVLIGLIALGVGSLLHSFWPKGH